MRKTAHLLGFVVVAVATVAHGTALAMAPHVVELGGVLLSKGSVSAPSHILIVQESDHTAWFSEYDASGPSLASGYPGSQGGSTGGGIVSTQMYYDMSIPHPDPCPQDPIPEPATMVLLGSGLLTGGLTARRYLRR